ncbi:ferredoxin reductase [Acinetobacter bouvetii]|uniref:Stearoyl-CoA 9-desaturase electron transfer partner n=1 Tax=Acinetobacter bouvetii TaxID=202951 RepID=A0A811G558_9GAMM|nr:ferredoxin reductase [Acinetobacter bouvetii]CAB1206619.1 Stearoyl-CoA 9-desaturase electron transfer partner [Acinetobacter bouvetii]
MSHVMQYQPQWIREDFVDFIAEKINPVWAWKKVKASIVDVHMLSQDFYQIQLQPNHNFRADAFRAGQSILVTVVIAGVRQQRSYSIVKITANDNIVIAVKRQGKVSHALTNLAVGNVVEISQVQGDFTLSSSQKSVLLLASGSGITAIYALLQQALKQNVAQIDLIYFSRDEAFHRELQQLSEQYSQFQYHHFNTVAQKQHLTAELLESTVADFRQRQSYACGAAGMMQSLNQIYQDLDISQQLKQEYFQIHVDETATAQPVVFLRAQQQFEAQTNLLDSAEQAGLKPAHGCRMGICNTCTCTKVSGSTKNLLTGEIDHDSNSQIKLCISQAVSPVTINL